MDGSVNGLVEIGRERKRERGERERRGEREEERKRGREKERREEERKRGDRVKMLVVILSEMIVGFKELNNRRDL